jgi:hypothetical protein
MLQFASLTNRSTRFGWLSAIVRMAGVAAVVTMIWNQAVAANPKKPPKEAPKEAAKPTPTSTPAPRLPTDLNQASMRVKALDELYELDLSVDQLKKLRAMAAGAASTKVGAPPKGTDKLVSTLQEFQLALLQRTDDKQIDELRNKVATLTSDDDVALDDSVEITTAARGKAADVLKQLTASQIAAFLAAHADEVGDPGEMMVGAINQMLALRAGAEGDAAAGKSDAPDSAQDNANEAADLVRDTSTEVGELVAGLDEARAKSVTDDVAKWLNTHNSMKDEDFVAKRKTLAESARAVVGNIHPMRVLDNWLEHRMATVLSNPQLPAAIDAIIQFKQLEE